MIGYWLMQELVDAGIRREVVTLVTQTEVDAADPAMTAPTKFIGPVYTRERAEALHAEHDWAVATDGGRWRRVVPSPEPVAVVELAAIEMLVAAGFVVVCGGGGGVPVVRDEGRRTGVAAVVDKDSTAALLAIALDADRLLILTDVDAVKSSYGTSEEASVASLTVAQASLHNFPAGSMGPKVAAALRFVSATGRTATIGALTDAAALLDRQAGTTFLPDAPVDSQIPRTSQSVD
jgi:carbamate kinase